MPALNKAKIQARSAVCMSNLSQIGKALAIYYVENGEKRFNVRNKCSSDVQMEKETNYLWMGKLAKYLGDKQYVRQFDEGVVIDVLMCPAAPKEKFRDVAELQNGSGQYGNNSMPWMLQRRDDSSTYGTYGINMWIANDFGPTVGAEYYRAQNTAQKAYKKVSQMKSDTPVFGDRVWAQAWPDFDGSGITLPSAADPDMLERYVDDQINMTGMQDIAPEVRQTWRFFLPKRHSKKTNIVFADSHVEAVDLKDLWSLKWNRDFPRAYDVTINY